MFKHLLILMISMSYAYAHPVIYKGGWVFQGTFMPQMNEMNIGYTLDPHLSLVANSNRFELNEEYQDFTMGLNALVHRWLQSDSQGNLYIGAHFGHYQDDDGKGQAGNVFIMADWEDREDYILFKSKKYYYDNKESEDYLLRYGFAPYVGGMNTLQTWMILQTYFYEEQSKEVMITPMLRFFYNNVLWEIGSSTKGDSFLTLMVHY